MKRTQIKEIICVDDGSTDGSADYIKNNFKDVKVIKLDKNQGKARAVFEGAKAATTDLLLLLDADLIKIETAKIDFAIDQFKKDEYLDLIIFKMKHFFLISKLLRHDVLISGNLVIKKEDLLKIFKYKRPIGYELEIAINQYMLDKNKKVRTVSFDSEGYSPVKKMGMVNTFKRDLFMYPDFIRFLGFKNLIKQMLFFATQEIK